MKDAIGIVDRISFELWIAAKGSASMLGRAAGVFLAASAHFQDWHVSDRSLLRVRATWKRHLFSPAPGSEKGRQ